MSKVKNLVWSLFIITFLCLPARVRGQGNNPPYNLSGTVLGAKNLPVSGASIQLIRQPSGTLVKVELSGPDGRFIFQNLVSGEYQIAVSHYEYSVYQSLQLKLEKDLDLGTITLPERTITLKEVAVAGKKPFIEQQFDKTVLNVENSITAVGSNTLEVLEKAPGLVIDQNDNITMRGKPGVQVMIDGKRVPMSGADLAQMLRGLAANSVEKIELITNPSAKYDAAGNAGIIDIRLKKDKSLGTNGSLTSSYGQGRYPKINQGLQINHRNKKVNVFGSYNFTYRKDFTFLDIYRRFLTGETYLGAYDQQNRFHYAIRNHTARAGADYYVSPKTIVGVVVNGFLTDLDRENSNKSLVLDEQYQPQSYFLTQGDTHNKRPNGGLNFNLKHTLDSVGREITADLDYIVYENTDIQNYTTDYYNLSNELTRAPYLLYGNLEGDLTIKSAKVDYSQPLRTIKASLEAGLKSSLVNADNDLRFFNQSNGGNILDPTISNHFIYKENINAAYINANKKWEKASMQLGLRLENTRADGTQVTDGQEFNRNYTQLFPSAFVGYTLSKKHDLGLSLSRRIDRPTYNQLNPFKSFLDPSTYSAGNPFLKPELTYSFEFTHTYQQKIITKYSYSRTNDVIINVLSPDPNQEKVIIQTNLNLAKLDYYGITVTLPASLGKWLTSTNNGTLYYGLYRGNLANTNLSNGRPTFNLNSNNTIILAKDWSAEIVGVYRSREIYGFLDVQPIWFVSGGVQKQLWNRKGNIKLNVSDGFYTNKTRATTALTGYTENFYQRRDSRVVTLSFMYRFGGNQVAPSRRRVGGAEDEKRRAG